MTDQLMPTHQSSPRFVQTATLAAISCCALIASCDALAQSTSLSAGRTVAGSISAGDTARYTFEAGDDYFVLGEVDQILADVDVRLLSPDGERLGNSSGPGRGAERFAARPPEAGTYTIELTPDEGESDPTGHTLHAGNVAVMGVSATSPRSAASGHERVTTS